MNVFSENRRLTQGLSNASHIGHYRFLSAASNEANAPLPGHTRFPTPSSYDRSCSVKYILHDSVIFTRVCSDFVRVMQKNPNRSLGVLLSCEPGQRKLNYFLPDTHDASPVEYYGNEHMHV